jgi:hypothetical protein
MPVTLLYTLKTKAIMENYVSSPSPKNQNPESKKALIDEKIKENIRKYAEQSRHAIDQRIEALDKSWDFERALQLKTAALIFAGILLYTSNRKWAILSILATVFLTQQAISGNCKQLKFLNFLGMRTRREINKEKFALKALRGDFDNIKNDIEKAWEAVKDEDDKRPIGFLRDIKE